MIAAVRFGSEDETCVHPAGSSVAYVGCGVAAYSCREASSVFVSCTATVSPFFGFAPGLPLVASRTIATTAATTTMMPALRANASHGGPDRGAATWLPDGGICGGGPCGAGPGAAVGALRGGWTGGSGSRTAVAVAAGSGSGSAAVSCGVLPAGSVWSWMS